VPSIDITITDEVGLHARPAAKFVKTAMRFDADIAVSKGDKRADAKSLVQVLQLEAGKGSTVTIEADGGDADEALDALGSLLQQP
jgi:phosphocarrier protein HPr